MLLRSILTAFLLIGSIHVAMAADPVGKSTVTEQNHVGGVTDTVTLTDQDAGYQQHVRPGTIIKIQLPAQFGTGYSWHRSGSTGPNIQQIERPTVSSDVRPGGWRDQIFTFSTPEPGAYTLSFTYQNPGVQSMFTDKKITFNFAAD
jgi:predicted secreted protein